jgi:flagellar biosynthetic protein FliR
VDPTTQADASVLQVLAQLAAGILFFALGLHCEVLRVLAHSLAVFPPGGFSITRQAGERMIALGAGVFSLGLRLSLPVLALLILVDLAMALLGRINSQLQLLSSAFPAKMLLGLVVMAFLMAAFPRIYRAYAAEVLPAVRGMLVP